MPSSRRYWPLLVLAAAGRHAPTLSAGAGASSSLHGAAEHMSEARVPFINFCLRLQLVTTLPQAPCNELRYIQDRRKA